MIPTKKGLWNRVVGLRRPGSWLTLLIVLCLTLVVFARAAQQTRTLILTGHPGELPVLDMNGRSYVEVEAIAQLVNGSISFRGNQIVLTLSSGSANPTANAPTSPPAAAGLSRGFISAGIEQMSVIREWRSALTSAVQRGYPVTADWMTTFSAKAQMNLRLVSLAVSTDSDRSALQLLTNEFNNMKKLSDRFVEANQSQTYMPTDSLDNDPLDQSIVSCGHSLASMAASGQFVNDGSCQ
jgi:hypothetical protein